MTQNILFGALFLILALMIDEICKIRRLLQKTADKENKVSESNAEVKKCPVCNREDIWNEAIRRAEYVFKGQPVKDAQEVLDYILAEVYSMFEIEKKKGGG